MGLVRVLRGNTIQAQDINQFIDLFTGGMTDQVINFGSGTPLQHLQAVGAQYTAEGLATPAVRVYAATYIFNLAGDANVSPAGVAHITIPFTGGLVSAVGSVCDHQYAIAASLTITQTVNPVKIDVYFYNPGMVTAGIVRWNLVALGW